MNISFNIEIVKKGKWYVARAPELDFVTQGATVDEAKNNILELIDIQFEEMKEMGTLQQYLKNNLRAANISREEYFRLLDQV